MRKSLIAALFYRVTRAIFSRRSLVKSDFKRKSEFQTLIIGREFRNKLKSLLAEEAFFTYVQYSIGKLKNIWPLIWSFKYFYIYTSEFSEGIFNSVERAGRKQKAGQIPRYLAEWRTNKFTGVYSKNK